MSVDIHRTVVTSFEKCQTNEENLGYEQDGGVYLFDVDILSDRSAIVASSSDNCISFYDIESLQQIRKIKAHSQIINGFDTSKSTPTTIFSASNDSLVLGWDLRIAGDSPTIRIKLSDEVTALSIGVTDTLLAAGCGTAVSFYDIRGGSKASIKLGEYSDVHTDTITQLRFSKANSHLLASGAEDGLMTVYNTSASDGDDAVVSIFNTECPIRRMGYFGHDDEAMYCLSTTETASFWHVATAQRVCDFSNIRSELVSEYLVDCMYDTASDTLSILAGNYDGSAKLAVVEPTGLRVTAQLSSGGHNATIRCAKNYICNNQQQMRFITGGEDARLSSWNYCNSADTGHNQSMDTCTADVPTGGSSNLKSVSSTNKKSQRKQKPY